MNSAEVNLYLRTAAVKQSLLLSSTPSSSPLCRVFILIFLRQTISLGNTVLQLFCCAYIVSFSIESIVLLHQYFPQYVCSAQYACFL